MCSWIADREVWYIYVLIKILITEMHPGSVFGIYTYVLIMFFHFNFIQQQFVYVLYRSSFHDVQATPLSKLALNAKIIKCKP